MERSIHDALCVVRRVMESGKVVVGGGAVEAALNIYLENFATSLVGACDTASDTNYDQIGSLINKSDRPPSLPFPAYV